MGRGAAIRRPSRAARLALALGGLLLLAVLAADLAQPPESQAAARLLIGAIEGYQATVSPLIGAAGVACRFEPTCSHYAVGAIRRHGALGGSWRALRRLLRCGPWTPAGTLDPP